MLDIIFIGWVINFSMILLSATYTFMYMSQYESILKVRKLEVAKSTYEINVPTYIKAGYLLRIVVPFLGAYDTFKVLFNVLFMGGDLIEIVSKEYNDRTKKYSNKHKN